MNCLRKFFGIYALFYAAGCSTPGTYYPPVELDPTFMGFGLAIHFGGYSVPAKVVVSAAVSSPVVLVPPTAPVTSGTVQATNVIGQTASLPVQLSTKISTPLVVVPK